MLRRAIADVDVQRRELAGDCPVTEPGKSIDGIKLIAPSRDQRSAEIRIKEILAADSNGKCFVGLGGQRCFFLAGRALGFLAYGFSRSSGVETIRNAVFDLVRVGNGINVIKANDAAKIVDARDASIDEIRLDHVSKPN